jgi:diguanylate cyclase (GGDEF)-like protein/PAS domain S-box-containing protein
LPSSLDALTSRVHAARMPTAAIAIDGLVLDANDAFGRLVGTPSAALVGCPLTDLTVDGSPVLRMLLEVAAGLDGGEVDLDLRTADGAALHTTMAWTVTRDERGAGEHVTLVCGEIAPRREIALAESAARLRSLLEHSPDTAWTADEVGTVTSATVGMLAPLGWDVSQVVGQSVFYFIHPDDLPRFHAAWDRVVGGKARQESLECRARQSGGGWSWVRETLTDLRDDPHVRSVVGWAVDVSDSHREAELRAQYERHFRAAFEQSAVPQAIVDTHALLAAVNDAYCALLGRARDDLVGRPVKDVSHARDNGAADEAIARLLAGELQSAQVERIAAGPDGAAVPVLSDLSLLRDSDGAPAGVAVFWHDQSALRDVERQAQQQRTFFDALTANASELALVIDDEARLIYVSPAIRHLLGYDAEALLTRQVWDFVHPEDMAASRETFSAVMSEGGTRSLLARAVAADESWHWLETTATNLIGTSIGGVVCNLRDVTDRVLAEQALRESEARYRAIADTAAEGILSISPSGEVLYANDRLVEILGLDDTQLAGRSIADLIEDQALQRFRRMLAGRDERGTERYEIDFVHPDGRTRWLSVAAAALRDENGAFQASLSMVSDITEARRSEEELRHAALHDTLTGLPNRALLIDRLEHALARDSAQTAVLYIDLDQFKLVNDARGHGVGDDVLMTVASRLAEAVRPSDTVARFGGDEFVLLLEDADSSDAAAFAHELLASLKQPISHASGTLHLGASIGIATGPSGSASDLLRNADNAMYAAKAAGRGRVRVFDRALGEETELGHALAAELVAALTNDELTLAYQPVVDLASGLVLGMEALARWTSPTYGEVPPARFVATAEMSGMALELDRWVVRTALAEAQQLRAAGVVPLEAYIAVNLSARSLVDGSLEEAITETAERVGLPPELVVLEITESAIMEDTATAIAILARLRARGFGIAIDDFGTGYSSLSYLRDLPISILKIDRSFVAGITEDRDALAIAASIVDLARAVGVSVIAEGIETSDQAALLKQLGCSAGQGWLWCRALPPSQIPAAGWTGPCEPVPELGPAPSVPAGHVVRREHGIDRLLAMHQQGASLATIASALNREGYRTPTGQRWHSATVARAITRSAYPALEDD